MSNIDCHILDTLKIPSILQTALTDVLEARPENPIAYLGVHYEWEPEKASFVKQAAQLLLHVHHSCPVFGSRVRKAYEIISQCPAHKGLRGLTGDVHMDLLQLLTQDVPEKEASRLMERMHCRATEIVPFSVFRTGIYTCLIFKEFVAAASAFYQDLDVFHEGQARRSVCDAVLNHLWNACVAIPKSESVGTSSPSREDNRKAILVQLRSGVKALKESTLLNSIAQSSDRKISAERFLSQAVDVFMLKLH